MSRPLTEYYRAFGQPATAFIVVNTVPTGASTITINGTVYTYGTNWQGAAPASVARNLAALINADPAMLGEHSNTQPVLPYYAVYFGNTIRLIATAPGTAGNSLTLATSDSASFTISGATFSGGTTTAVALASGNTPAFLAPAANNASYTALASQAANFVRILNDTGVVLSVTRGGSGNAYNIPIAGVETFHVVANANELSVKAASGGPFTLSVETW